MEINLGSQIYSWILSWPRPVTEICTSALNDSSAYLTQGLRLSVGLDYNIYDPGPF